MAKRNKSKKVVKNLKPEVVIQSEEITANKSGPDLFFLISVAIFLALAPLVFYKDVYQSFSLFKSYTLKMGIGLISIFWFLYKIFSKWDFETIRKSLPLGVPILLITIFTGISCIYGIDPWINLVGIYTRQIGLQGIATMTVAFFILAFSISSRSDINKILWTFTISGMLIGFYALLQYYNLDFFQWVRTPFTKVPSTTGNANLCGNVLSLMFPLSIYFIMKKSSIYEKYLGGFCSIAILLGIVFSQSRAIWLTFLIAIVFQILILIRIFQGRIKHINLAKGLLIFSLAIVLFVLNSFLITRYETPLLLIISLLFHVLIFTAWKFQHLWTDIKIKNFILIHAAVMLVTIGGIIPAKVYWAKGNYNIADKYFSTFHFEKIPRYFLFRDSLKVIKDHFFFGTGVGTYRIAFMPYKSLENEKYEPKANYDSPHNNYLTVFATQGVFSFIAYMAIFFLFFRKGLKTILDKEVTQDDKLLMSTLLTALFVYAVWSLSSFDSNVTNPVIVSILAMFSTLYYLIFRKKETSSFKYGKQTVFATKIIMAIMIPLAILSVYNIQVFYNADAAYAKGLRYRSRALSLFRGKKNKQASAYLKVAKDNLLKAHELNPRESFYSVDIASLYYTYYQITKNKTFLPKTKKYLEKSREHEWDPGKYYVVEMQRLMTLGKSDDAIKLSREILKDLPYNHIVRSRLGYLLFLKRTANAYKEALVHFNYTLKIYPNDLKSLVFSSEIYLAFRKFDLAKQLALKALKHNKNKEKEIKKLLLKIESESKKVLIKKS